MRRAFAGAAVGLCLAGGLVAPSQAAAEPDTASCQDFQPAAWGVMYGESEVMESGPKVVTPRDAAKLESVDPTRLSDLTLGLRDRDCWADPRVSSHPGSTGAAAFVLSQNRTDFKASVSVEVDLSRAHRDLEDVLDDDRLRAQQTPTVVTYPDGTSAEISVLEDIREDYQGFPSWLHRTRTSQHERNRQLSLETTTREVAVTAGANTYLVTISGVTFDAADTDIADDVGDHVSNDLVIEVAS